jgi:hypothetical protein
MKKYNISVPKKYTKDGVEKIQWNNIGKLVRFDATTDKPEGFALELHMFPDTKFGVFEDKPKENTNTENFDKKESQAFEESKIGRVASNTIIENDINPEDIPF